MLASAVDSWKMGMALLSGVILISLLLTLPVAVQSRRMAAPGPGKTDKKEFVPFPRDLFRLPVFWTGLLIMALAMWSNLAFTDLCPGFLAVAPPVGAGYGPEVSGRLMSLPSISGMIGALLAGFLIDKAFNGKNRMVVGVGWVISSVFYTAVLLSSVHGNLFILAPVLLIAGLQNPFINVAVMSFAAKTFPPRLVGRIGGLWISVSFFAGSAGVMVGSLALHKTGTYRLSILILTAASIIGLFISSLLREPSAGREVIPDGMCSRQDTCAMGR
jgi:MFS family permease